MLQGCHGEGYPRWYVEVSGWGQPAIGQSKHQGMQIVFSKVFLSVLLAMELSFIQTYADFIFRWVPFIIMVISLAPPYVWEEGLRIPWLAINSQFDNCLHMRVLSIAQHEQQNLTTSQSNHEIIQRKQKWEKPLQTKTWPVIYNSTRLPQQYPKTQMLAGSIWLWV